MKLSPLRGTIAALVTLVSLSGCATIAATSTAPAEAIFVIVRHAEKATNDPKDPALSETGRARAQRLAERLADAQVSAVYATGYRRTQQTAAPTALAHRIEVRTYQATMTTTDLAAQLRSGHTTGVVLVVGHSNTVSTIAGALCGCEVAPLREDEYDRWIAIHADRNGATTLEEGRY